MQQDAEVTAQLLEVVTWWGKIAGSLGIVGAFMVKVLKPYMEWRKKHLANELRDAMKPELAQMNALLKREEGCVERYEKVLRGQEAIFVENDMMFALLREVRDGHEEIFDLLSALGLSANDRRSGEDRRDAINALLDNLDERRRHRRRRNDIDPDPTVKRHESR